MVEDGTNQRGSVCAMVSEGFSTCTRLSGLVRGLLMTLCNGVVVWNYQVKLGSSVSSEIGERLDKHSRFRHDIR